MTKKHHWNPQNASWNFPIGTEASARSAGERSGIYGWNACIGTAERDLRRAGAAEKITLNDGRRMK